MKAYEPIYFYTENFEIDAIIFDDESADVTLNGRFQTNSSSAAIECIFSCDFNILRDILLKSGENTAPIIDKLSEELSKDVVESPTMIDLNELMDDNLWVTGLKLKIYKAQDENEKGEWVDNDDNIFIIDSILSKEEKENMKAQLETKLEDAELLWNDYLQLLDNAMEYYVQLRQRGFEEEDAKQRTGLKDELLFRIGMINNTIKNLRNGQ